MIVDYVVLYSHDGQKKSIQLDPHINIITGDTGTGKTTLCQIIDYCLAASKCRIKRGPMLDRLCAVGLVLNNQGDVFFIARMLPPNEKQCYAIQSPNGVPDSIELDRSISLEELSRFLSFKIGLKDRIMDLETPFVPSIRNVVPLCIQDQEDLISSSTIIHDHDYDYFKRRHIRTALPYFIGAYDVSLLHMECDRERIEDELKSTNLIKFNSVLKNKLENKVDLLITHALSLGLLQEDMSKGDKARVSCLTILSELNNDYDIKCNSVERVTTLQKDLEKSMKELRELNYEMNKTREVAEVTKEFFDGKERQLSRLKMVNLFSYEDELCCPLCGSKPEKNKASIIEIKEEMERISNSLKNAKKGHNQIQKYINAYEERSFKLKERIRMLRKEIVKVQKEATEKMDVFDSEVLKVKIEATYLLEMMQVNDSEEICRERQLKEELASITKRIENGVVLENYDLVMNRLSNLMTKYGLVFEIIGMDETLRFDIASMMPYIVKNGMESRAIIKHWGSGYRVVCGHIITLLALHVMMSENSLSLPSFIFFDQLTSATPGDNQKDAEKNRRTFAVLKEYTEENPNVQLILADHYLPRNKDELGIFTAANWWDGDCLVPLDWPTSKE